MKKIITKAKKPTKKILKKKVADVKVVNKPNKSWLGVLAIANLLAFLAVVVINYLAVSLPIAWNTTWALSDLYPNLFTPAGITFSIWGLIYLSLFWFVVWQIVDLYKKQSNGITKKIWIWFVISCLANISWIFSWHYKQVLLSVVIMLIFLIVLSVISYKVEMWKKLWTRWDKLLVQIPFSLYLWWISVAIIANISAWLVNMWWGARGASDIFWTITVIIVAALLALLSLYKKYNVIFALVVIWAFIGIIIKRVAVDPVYASGIIWTLGVCIAVISAGIGLKFEQWRKN